MPIDAKHTADALLLFDSLFDSMNGSFEKRKKFGKPLLGPATPTSAHHNTWNELKPILKKMKFINKNTLKNEYVPTLDNWVWTLEGTELLLKNLQRDYNITSVWLRHLNQDPIENFFGSIRSHGCRDTNPSSEKFESVFTSLLINSLSSVHAPGANCEVDNCVALHKVLITGGPSKEPKICELQEIPDISLTPLENKNDPRILGGLTYVAGYFAKKTKEKVFKGCKRCNTDLLLANESEYVNYREYNKRKWLCSPSHSLLNFVSNLQDINYSILKQNLNNNYIKDLIITIINIYVDFSFITCQKHREDTIRFILNLSCRFFIHNYCKNINKILVNKRECDDDSDVFKVKAKKMYKKCFKRKK